jgi:hypothetical protein
MNEQQLRELELVNLFAIYYGNHSIQYYAKKPASEIYTLQQFENIKSAVDVYIMRRFARAAHHFANIINMQHQP